MKNHIRQFYPIALLVLLITSCQGQDKTKDSLNSAEPLALAPLQMLFNIAELSDYKIVKADTKLHINWYIRSMLQDQKGDLWMGTYHGGAAHYDGSALIYLNNESGMSGNVIREMAEDKSEGIWFATDGGVSYYNGKSFKNYSQKDGLGSNNVWSVLIDKQGTLWFGTDEGAYRFDGKSFTSFTLPEADLSKFKDGYVYPAPKLVNDIFQDKAGNIWFATNGGGVYCYDGKTTTNISEKEGLCNNFVQSVSQDNAGNMWFSSRFGGVSKYDGKNLMNISEKDGLSNKFIWSVFDDGKGGLWFATGGGGVCRYNGKTFETYTKKDGFASDYVQSIMMDKAGNIWFGTSQGLTRFDGVKFESFPEAANTGC